MNNSFKPRMAKKSTSISIYNQNDSEDCLESCKYSETTLPQSHQVIRPILIIGQIFGLMPICGVSSASIFDLQFKWKSKRTIYSLLIAAGLSVHSLLLFGSTVRSHRGILKFGATIFCGVSTLSCLCFLVLARKWPKLMKLLMDVEHQLPSFQNIALKRRFTLKIRITVFAMLVVLLANYLNDLGSEMYIMIVCEGEKHPLVEIHRIEAPYLFTSENVSVLALVCIRFIAIVAYFVSSYNDIFVMMIGIILTNQFKLFNDELKRTQGEYRSIELWTQRRVQYTKLSELVRKFDKAITSLIFISFANNLFFICSHLFNSLKPHPTLVHLFYFWFSLIVMVLRIFYVMFWLSAVNDESKKSIAFIYAVPSNSWNTEVKRFYKESSSTTIAFSGLRFFHVTRPLMLSVVGTIVTYELVLLNFSLSDRTIAHCGT